MVLVHCISRSHRLKIDFQDENFEKIFLSETTMPRALIFSMKHLLKDLYQVCSNYLPGAKMALPGGNMFYLGLYRENMKKKFLSETTNPRALIFGM